MGCKNRRKYDKISLYKNIIQKQTLQKHLYVSSILCVSGAKEKISEVFTVLIQYLDNPDSDPTVSHVFLSMHTYSKYYQLTTPLFYFITDVLLQESSDLKKTPSLTDCLYLVLFSIIEMTTMSVFLRYSTSPTRSY